MTLPTGHRCSRRALLAGTAASTAAIGLAPWSRLLATSGSGHRIVVCHFTGGWDVLFGPDSRDPARNYSEIDLAIERLEAANAAATLGNTYFPGHTLTADQRAAIIRPFEISVGGRNLFWGPGMLPLQEHADVLTLFNGVNMNTVAHEVGQQYSYTGRRPSGTVANGDAIGTAVVALGDAEPALLNTAIRMPAYNVSFPAAYGGIRVNHASEFATLIEPFDQDRAFSPELQALLRTASDRAGSCLKEHLLDVQPGEALSLSRARLRQLQDSAIADRIDLASNSAEMVAVRDHYRLDATRPYRDEPLSIAATAAQLLKTGLSRAVTVQLERNFDTHNDWAPRMAERFSRGSFALARLLSDLRQDDPSLSQTTVLLTSEFSRTPHINGTAGRDHWFANSILVFGSTLKTGVFGATDEQTLGVLNIDPDTGLPHEAGIMLQPEHVIATLLKSLGAGDDYLSDYRVDPLDTWIARGGA